MGNPYQTAQIDPEESGETMPDDEASEPMPMMGGMKSPAYADKGGSKMGGGLGDGVEAPQNGDVGEAGYKCEATFPLTGAFWTRDSKHGQA